MHDLICFEPVEEALSGEDVDARLELGFFPFGQRWMTCRAWPRAEGTFDTVWLRVRLEPRPAPPVWRRLSRAGARVEVGLPSFDAEHQALYDRFRAARASEWNEDLTELVLHGPAESGLLDRTRELALRGPSGDLLAFRWTVEGREAIAGLTAVYEPAIDGLGSAARALADDAAARAGFRWSYPGYLFPGAPRSWVYKVKPGRTEWLDLESGEWRSWTDGPPDPEALMLAQARRELSLIGDVVHNPGWALPLVGELPQGLTYPFFVVRSRQGHILQITVWDHERGGLRDLTIIVHRRGPTP